MSFSFQWNQVQAGKKFRLAIGPNANRTVGESRTAGKGLLHLTGQGTIHEHTE